MESFISGIKKIVPVDVFIEIILKLPAPSVFNLCSTNISFRELCINYQDRMYNALLQRDGFDILIDKSAKQSYIEQFNKYGQRYIIDKFPDVNCHLTLSNYATLPTKNYINKPHFLLRPSIEGVKTSLTDYEKGTKYWVGGHLSEKDNNLTVFRNKHSAISFTASKLPKLLYHENLEKLKKSFPNDWEKFKEFDLQNSVAVRKILNRKGCLLYNNDEKYVFIVKQITIA